MPCQTTADFPCSPDTLGIRGGNSTKTMPCALTPHSSVTDTDGKWDPDPVMTWGNCCDLSALLGGSQTWHIRVGKLWQPLLTPRTFSQPTPFGHLFTHTAPAGWIGLPLRSDACLCSASSPHFHPGSRGMPQSLTPAAGLHQQLKGLHS